MSRDTEIDRNASSPALAVGVGLVAGALVGAAIGLLFAPKSGAALRRDIARRAREVQDGAADQFERFGEMADDFADRGRKAARRAREVVATGIDEACRCGAAVGVTDESRPRTP